MSDLKSVLNTAANILSYAPRSRASLINRLLEKGVDGQIAAQAADRLCELNLLNDAAFAAALTESYMARGYGRAHIRNALKQKLLEIDDIDAALEAFSPNEEKMEKYIASRLKGKEIDRRATQRVSEGLFRRGFSWDEINTAIRNYLSAMEDETLG